MAEVLPFPTRSDSDASIRRVRDAMDDATNAAWLNAIREGRLRPPSMGAIPITEQADVVV